MARQGQQEKVLPYGLGNNMQTKEERDLGFRPLTLMNKALIGKCLWRLGEEQGSLGASC